MPENVVVLDSGKLRVKVTEIEDYHCGWREIVIGQEVTVVERKQMAVFQGLILDGTILVEGELILE